MASLPPAYSLLMHSGMWDFHCMKHVSICVLLRSISERISAYVLCSLTVRSAHTAV